MLKSVVQSVHKNWIYVAGSGSDQLSIRASDGTLWSAWQTATGPPPLGQAPEGLTSSKTVMRNQSSIAASSLFTATDPEGYPITPYALKDLTGKGQLVVNGVVQPKQHRDRPHRRTVAY